MELVYFKYGMDFLICTCIGIQAYWNIFLSFHVSTIAQTLIWINLFQYPEKELPIRS